MPQTALPLTRQDFKTVVQKTIEEFREASGLIIRAKSSLLDEAYASALSSLRFHNIKFERVNHYKVVAHLAYWIHRLQPIRFASPSMMSDVAAKVFAAADQQVEDKAGLKRSRRQFGIALRSYRLIASHFTIFPINEYVAWILIYDEIGVVWREILEQERFADKHDTIRVAIHAAESRYRNQMDDLIWSLRYHTYSARSFSTLVEAMFRVDGL
jgi:hypothetical protein